MLTFPLTLKPASAPVREVCAWFLPGDDAAEWLATVASWRVPTEKLWFYLVPDPVAPRPAGALVVVRSREGSKRGGEPGGGRALPYGRVAEDFFIPVDAVFSVPVAEEELRRAMRHPVQVWHPLAGLCGFEADQGLRAWDLVLPPEPCEERWNLARAVEPTCAGLRNVRVKLAISPEDIFGDESKDIGSEPGHPLPPAPGEAPSGLVGKVAQGALKGGALGARAITALMGLVPRRPGPATWVNHVEDWARAKLQGVSADLEKARHRELHRLLDMLEKDPSRGLRHAISLADLANRGRAAPSGSLANRGNLDFNLRRLGGGGPADPWQVPDAVRSSLAAKYRAAAQREAALGNHRRAACIFAELLGDFSSAAEMLKRGRFFAEAAVLYRERLRNEIAEAECLAEGGFYDEAIAIHERRERWQEAAALQEKAGRQEAARAAWRRAVEKLLAAGDQLGAAKLLESRLRSPEEALAHLTAAWPHGKQALACLTERFALLGRRHDQAAIGELLAELGEAEPPAGLTASVVGQLAGLAETLVHEPNRQAAAEAVRVRAAAALAAKTLDGADETAVLRSLTRIEPQDRVLKRDVLRYREARLQAAPGPSAPTVAKNTAPVRKVTLEKQAPLSLPRVGPWLLIEADEREIHAVARFKANRLMLTRGAWTGAMQSAEWEDPQPEAKTAPLLTRVDYGGRLVLTRPFSKPLEPKVLGPSAAFHDQMVRVATPPWWAEDIVAVSFARSALWALRVVQDRLVLASYQMDALAHSRDLTDEVLAAGAEGGGGNLCMQAQGGDGRIGLGLGRHLVVVDGDRPVEPCDLGARIRALLPAPSLRPGWVALLERGVVFVDARTRQTVEVDGQMEMPRGAFLGDGRLVLVGPTEGRLVEWREDAVVSAAWFEFKGQDVFAVTRTPHPREFCAFDATGVGQRWQLPA